MSVDHTPEPAADEAALRAEIARLNKVVNALMNRAERGMSAHGSDFGLFQTAVMLEDQVHERTKQLEEALHENEKITRALQRTQEQMEREIEQRKQANEALERAMAQLVQTEKLASLGSLVAGVAHELNTPLGIAVTVSSSLKAMAGKLAGQIEQGALRKQELLGFLSQCSEAVELLENNLHRAAGLIGNFKQVAVDQTSVRRRSFDLAQALDEVLTALQPKIRSTTHRLEVLVPAGILLDSYPGPFEQIISNLFTNALLHGFEGVAAGTIRIEAEAGVEHVLLRFADDGVGMSPTVAKHAFDPFFTTKLGKGGSGLGLYIVYNLATAVLGGSVQLDSEPGGGTRIELRLPLKAPGSPTRQEA